MRWVVGLGLLVAATIPSVAGAAPKPVVTTASVHGLGVVLVSGHRTLYVDTHDHRGHTSCTGACALSWPPLLVPSGDVHHLGHLHELGTIHRPHGKLQVTFHGRPLYFFAEDRTLVSATGEGVDDVWFAVHPDGALAHVAAPAHGAAPAVPASQPGTGSPTTTSPSTTSPTGHSGGSPPATSSPGPSTTTTSPARTVPTSPAATTQPVGAPPTTPPTSTPSTTVPSTTPPSTVPPTTTTTTAPTGGGISF